MSNRKNNHSEKDSNKTEEPKIGFNTIRIFNSFEEIEEDEIRWLASLTPQEHLQNTTSLIKRVFADDLKQHPEIGNEIHFE